MDLAKVLPVLAIVATAALVIHVVQTSNSFITNPTRGATSTRRTRRSKRKNEALRREQCYIMGLHNTGNTCFMNAVLQAMASLPSLRIYLDSRRETTQHPNGSITLALGETMESLNQLYSTPKSDKLGRLKIIVAQRAGYGSSKDQQDAQELFQILSSQLTEERDKIDSPATVHLLDRNALQQMVEPSGSMSSSTVVSGSGSIVSATNRSSNGSASISSSSSHFSRPSTPPAFDHMSKSFLLAPIEQEKYHRARSPFMGLLASRVSCVDCDHTAAIRHSTFDNLSLTIPTNKSGCSIEECLQSYIHLDTISDFNCRKCTLLQALQDVKRRIKLAKEQDRSIFNFGIKQSESTSLLESSNHVGCTEASNGNASGGVKSSDISSSLQESRRRSSGGRRGSVSKRTKINLAEVEKVHDRILACLESDIDMDLSPIDLTEVRSKKTTKHTMVAKPPQTLVLHLNRSMILPSGVLAKNSCCVRFQKTLDFTPFTTSGHLTMSPTRHISDRSIEGTTVNSRESETTFPRLSNLFGVDSLSRQSNAATSVPSSVGSISIPKEESSRIENTAVNDDRVLYRLQSVIVHLGRHNSGHFLTFRRIPEASCTEWMRLGKGTATRGRPFVAGKKLELPETTAIVAGDNNEHGAEEAVNANHGRERGEDERWWCISDASVKIVTWAEVENVEAYMLFYERETRPE